MLQDVDYVAFLLQGLKIFVCQAFTAPGAAPSF